MNRHLFSLAALLIMIILAFGSVDSTSTDNGSSPSSSSGRKWYEGGTLHDKGALDWQEASYEDKLATCGDFVAGLWQGEQLKPSIQNSIQGVDDMRPYAEELVVFLDAATKKRADAEENRRIYANQKVSEMTAMGIAMMGWTTKSPSGHSSFREDPSPARQAPEPNAPGKRTRTVPKRKEYEFRTWTDDTGKYTIEAKFLSYGVGKVTLEKKDGAKTTLPMERLSPEDQEWVKRLLW